MDGQGEREGEREKGAATSVAIDNADTAFSPKPVAKVVRGTKYRQRQSCLFVPTGPTGSILFLWWCRLVEAVRSGSPLFEVEGER